MIENGIQDIEFLRKNEVMKLFNVSRAVFDRWQNPKSEYFREDFPKKIKFNGLVFYVKEEVQRYMQKLIDER
ncbi:helix-turn-helix transcriptional regulator [Actinobacillus equuli]|uniref:Prophage CP4-57 regulatory protein n=1 Tax=Actinobacillus lignieresii TaxID=720 RepID=A0A376BDB8_ACTLI|nr:AlpA family phage regulatory protein [Actinobacillus equuli]WGE76056.1 AlpA family phage regulatory protein [Actinobacillus equuli subsp. haemolyticus]WGE78074.1 AlpA family phage regulatory protein [Actinobacillus equuli subsp. haemolyticus]SSX60342.1 prophage CP4-57 regulatory protein [Actinobacillus lignieresii]SUT91434.1 prophage CP4-57 regulatory protein [Actinobacillus lignieresii]